MLEVIYIYLLRLLIFVDKLVNMNLYINLKNNYILVII